MITREQAIKILHANMANQNLRRHCYAVEAVMKALYRELEGKGSSFAKASEDKWGIVGLLHDGDYEKTKQAPDKHTILMYQWLKEALRQTPSATSSGPSGQGKPGETDEEILHAILTHNYAHTGETAPATRMEWALYTCDELTGLIVATTLVRPDKKLASVTVESVLKKFPEKAFAAGVKREQIELCQDKLGIPLNQFVGIALQAMQGISQELGL